jgi:Kelch motif
MDGIKPPKLPSKRARRRVLSIEERRKLIALRARRLQQRAVPQARLRYSRLNKAVRSFLLPISYVLAAGLILFSIYWQVFEPIFREASYKLSPQSERLLSRKVQQYADKLQYNPKSAVFEYNPGYKPGGEVAGQVGGPKFSAEIPKDASKGVIIQDPTINTQITIKPKFRLGEAKKQDNRIIYPFIGKNAVKVYTTRASSVKEDIILNQFVDDSLRFEYELTVPDGIQARLEKDGSIGFYGVSNTLLGNVSTSSDADAELLKKARTNGEKKNLVFSIPAPIIKELNKKRSDVNTWYTLQNNILVIHASNLRSATYPLSVDPSVYVETAAKLMRGNNETNTDFDVDDELFQKSQTTGARIDSWEGNLDMSDGIWDHSVAAAGGKIYRSGGRTGITKPQIVSTQSTADSTDGTSFIMDMPTTRPAGDLYIAMMCHDGTVTMTPPAGWTEYADTREHAAYYKVGTDQGGGNESAQYTWTASGSEAFYGTIIRVTGFNSSSPISGTAGTGSDGAGAVPIFPATTPADEATLIVRAVGVNDDAPSSTAWVPSGHTKIASGNSGGTDCGFAAASLDTPPATSVSSGTATLNDTSLNDTYGASSIAIKPSDVISPPAVQSTTASNQSTDSLTFTMSMPSTRPAGDLYVALICKDGNNRITPPAGWTEYADLQEHGAYYKVGTDQGGGNEAATYQWTVATTAEQWYGVILRITGFNSSDIEAGTPGTGSSGSNTTPAYPTMTPDANKTLIVRSTGIDDDVPSSSGWLPAAHTKIASGSSGGGSGDCGFTAASMDSPPASGVATGAVNLGEMNDSYGASTLAINPDTSTTPDTAQSTLDWASFDSATLEIESPNPGEGVCDGWCNDPTYNMPEARRGHSMVAYNGYLYVMGGVDGSGNRESTVLIAKLGANGEPQLWHPTDTDKNNWEYWYTDTGLNGATARSYLSAAAYNNRMYILGGQTNASAGGTTTCEYADIKPNGTLATWSTCNAISSARHGHTMHIYNDVVYIVGGNSSGTLQNSVYYAKIDPTDGSLETWTATSSFTTARSAMGGSYTTVWGAYLYLSGGCTAVNGSGYCTTVASDTQLASINADGTISEWGSITNLTNQRAGYTIIGWQNGLYRLGGCTSQSALTGKCISTLADVDYGVINPAGEVSTVSISVDDSVAPCTGVSPYNCNLPSDTSENPGDDAGEIGHMLNAAAILNGYLYVFGGCAEYNCNTGDNSPTTDNVSSNTAFVSIASDGTLTKPASCSGNSYGSWCVDSTNLINSTDGIAAAGVTVFNNRIYLVGGFDSSGGMTGEIYHNTTNSTTGALSGAWTAVDLTTAGVAEDISYTFVYSRANPASAGSNPGNLYIFGGCGTAGTGAGCSSDYETEVYKCNITSAGSVSGCTTSGQLQIDSTPGSGGTDGLGLHSGTVYANYIYLIGGFSGAESDKDDVLYAKFDNSNNVVDADGETITDNAWIESPNKLSVGRRRGFAFGYNGHIYSMGGWDQDSSQVIPFIEWSKMNVSDGSIDEFVTSSIQINQRWGLTAAVSNSYAYVIGGCDSGSSPSGCTSFENAVQTFQLYNNDSGAIRDMSAQSDDTYATDTDRIGASAAVYNGYLYVAGGCTNIGCTTVTDNVQRAQLSESDGTVSSWSSTTDTTLPAGRAFGQLEIAGTGSANPTLYYVGGIENTTADERSEIYYGVIASNNVATWATATSTLPADRAYAGGTVWDNRIYIVGGIDDAAAVTSTVYVSPSLASGGNFSGTWASSTAFNVARSGAAVTAYANNLYLFGGYDGSNYLSDQQFASLGYKTGTIGQSGTTVTGSGTTFASTMVGSTIQYSDGSRATITAYSSTTSITVDVSKTVTAGSTYAIQDGSVGSWTYSNSLPGPIRDADAISANGYIYVVGGRSAASTCTPNVLITPISANTTIATGNNPTGTGEWYETNVRYTGDRYGSAVAYYKGKMYLMGGGCSSLLSSTRHYYSTLKSQPQVAIYSRLIDTDTDVFPTDWLLNGVDNSIGARWQLKYRSMHDLDTLVNPSEDCGTSASMAQMTTWGQETDEGDVMLGEPGTYTPKNSSGSNINCARYFFFFLSIDASKTFGYPEDTARGPTVSDLSLFFTSDPSKRLRHGKTFTGGEQQPLDTPF